MNQNHIYPKLSAKIEVVLKAPVTEARKGLLQVLIDYAQNKVSDGKPVKLNFICTHNSRRSQLAQIWAQTAAQYFGIDVRCFSGVIEVTAFNKSAVEAIRNAGFQLKKNGLDNPVFTISMADDAQSLDTFSKLYNDPANPTDEFAAVMTCDHADENCPFIPGTEQRIPLTYEDPKTYDGTPQEAIMYGKRSDQIAGEMFYVFSKIKI